MVHNLVPRALSYPSLGTRLCDSLLQEKLRNVINEINEIIKLQRFLLF